MSVSSKSSRRPAFAESRFSAIETLVRARYPLIYVVTWEEERAMMEMQRDMVHPHENNPKELAHMMPKLKHLMPPGTIPNDPDVPINCL